MKLYIGYIFSQGIDEVLAVGLSEWCIEEGQADIYDDIDVDDDLALSLGLSSELSEHWAKKEREEEEEHHLLMEELDELSDDEDEEKDQTNYWTGLKLYAKFTKFTSFTGVYKVISMDWSSRKITLDGPWFGEYKESFDDVIISDNPNM